MNINRIITMILQVVLVLMIPIFIIDNEHTRAIAAAIAVLFSFIPAIARRSWKVTTPWLFEFFIFLLLLTHLLGLHFELYSTFWWWDNVAHFLGVALIGSLGFYGVYSLHETRRIHLSPAMIALFAFFFAIAIGAIWEVAEFASDSIVGSNNQLSNYDTMMDLINDILGAALVAILGTWYTTKGFESRLHFKFDRWIEKRGE